ncbi:hypothetical protein ColTof4_13692 [Colletotrichum tofieldiae]|nr:hypothetical protein ColTof3_01858 [Colletotrichum tofieldiae]GKT81269.1 hypothetical protein ColTof4_13692 [Colletotrichum tofieldiae]GKT83945.1 hypothetical protein Ct61P_01795 [Colletotrichum tofieldiae]
MAAHAEHGPVAVTFAERVFQQLEDNRPSEAPVDFSDPLSNTSTPVKSKATETLSQPARGNTMGSANFYAQSKTGDHSFWLSFVANDEKEWTQVIDADLD